MAGTHTPRLVSGWCLMPQNNYENDPDIPTKEVVLLRNGVEVTTKELGEYLRGVNGMAEADGAMKALLNGIAMRGLMYGVHPELVGQLVLSAIAIVLDAGLTFGLKEQNESSLTTEQNKALNDLLKDVDFGDFDE